MAGVATAAMGQTQGLRSSMQLLLELADPLTQSRVLVAQALHIRHDGRVYTTYSSYERLLDRDASLPSSASFAADPCESA